MSRKWIALALKFLVSGLLIWFLLTKIDLAAALERAAEAPPAMLAATAAVFGVQYVIGTLRWEAVLTAIRARLGFAGAFRIFYIGSFFNQTLPSSVGGDAVRMYLARRAGLSLSSAVNGVMLERIVTVAGLLLLVAITQPFFLPRLSAEAGGWILPAIMGLAAVLAAGIGVLMALDQSPWAIARWRLVRALAVLGADARRIFLVPGAAARTLAWAVAGHVNIALAVYVLALALDLDVTWVDCVVLMPPVLLVTTLPISIAGWGVREGAMVVAFGMIGVPAEGALVLSILFGLMVVAVSLPGGLVWLLGGGRKKDVEVMALETEAPASPGANG